LSASSSMIGPIVRAFEMIASESTGGRSCIELPPSEAADRPSAYFPKLPIIKFVQLLPFWFNVLPANQPEPQFQREHQPFIGRSQ
jgi:hypothetical protein